MTKKVFISLPMRDRTNDEIRKDMNDILSLVKSVYEETGEDVELIDTVNENSPNPDVKNDGVWYLGGSILDLCEADLAIFHPEWRTARGCIIEHMICAMYNIPYFDISMDYGDLENDIVDNTHDWDMVGEINRELSDQLAEDEGLDDILNDEDVEDALGFEHDDVDDLVESDPDLNPDAEYKGLTPTIVIVDDFENDESVEHSDELEPGEYDADVR